jgi:hypothetical protein
MVHVCTYCYLLPTVTTPHTASCGVCLLVCYEWVHTIYTRFKIIPCNSIHERYSRDLRVQAMKKSPAVQSDYVHKWSSVAFAFKLKIFSYLLNKEANLCFVNLHPNNDDILIQLVYNFCFYLKCSQIFTNILAGETRELTVHSFRVMLVLNHFTTAYLLVWYVKHKDWYTERVLFS